MSRMKKKHCPRIVPIERSGGSLVCFSVEYDKRPCSTHFASNKVFCQHPSRVPRRFMYSCACSVCVNVISSGSPSRILRVLLISLGITTRPRSSDCVNQVQKIFVKPRKALKYKDFSAFGAFTPVRLIVLF